MIKNGLHIDDNGDKYWYMDGKIHRTDGPAIEKVNGDKYWYINGNSHRSDGPAVEKAKGEKYWLVHGKLHRLDGPAIEWINGDKFWYIDHIKYSFSEWLKLSSLSHEEKIELVLTIL